MDVTWHDIHKRDIAYLTGRIQALSVEIRWLDDRRREVDKVRRELREKLKLTEQAAEASAKTEE